MYIGQSVPARCEDGRTRKAIIRSHPDTYFSQPAIVRVKGKTVSGFVTPKPYGEEGYDFIAYSYGKNGHMIKKEIDRYAF